MNVLLISEILIGTVVTAGLVYGFVTLLQKITDKQELKKFILLGIVLGIIIAAYWMLRPLKDSFFSVIVGPGYRGYVKNLSVIVIIGLVLLYSKLLDLFPKNRVLYILTAAYGIALLGFMFLFMDPTIGPTNNVSDPSRLIGWMWYVFVESIGSLVVAAFWAFTTDITMPDAAKRGFPVMMLFAQIGNIFGPLSEVLFCAKCGGGVPFVGIAGLLLFCAGLLVWIFLRTTPKTYLTGFHGTHEEKEPGFFAGLKLLVSQKYLLCIFIIVALFELLATIVDIYLKEEVRAMYPTELGNTLFLAKYAVTIGIVAALSLILRIGELPRLLGIRFSLVLLPILVILGYIGASVASGLGYLVPGLFIVCVAFKAFNYALNGPTCKQLYIPTSKDAKYKSQAWIETFGSRGAKAGGGLLSIAQNFIATGWILPTFLIMSVGIVGLLWLPAVFYASGKYNKAIKNNEVVC